MRLKFIYALFSAFLLSSCNSPVTNFHKGLSIHWQNEGLDWNATSLVVHDGHLYGTTLNNTIFKADFLTGEMIWEAKASTNYMGQIPLIANNQIYIGGPNGISSYDLRGKLLWSHKTSKKVGHTIIHNDSLVFGSLKSKGLHAYSQVDGTVIWKNEPDYQMISSSNPSIRDSLIAIGSFDYSLEDSHNHTKLINANNGEVLWSKINEGHRTGEAIFYEESLFVCFDDSYKKGYVSALNLKDGSTLWKVASNPETSIKPLILQNSLLIASYKSGMDCLDLNTGDLKWTLDNRELVTSTKFVELNGLIYYGSQHRELICVNLKGEIQFRSKFNYGVGTPFIFENCVYIPDGGGTIYKFDNCIN